MLDVEESLRQRARAARAGIAAGTSRGAALHELLSAVPFVERDSWIDEALGIELPPPDVDLPRGAVPYLPCGVDEIITTVREAPLRPDDVLVDIGSGLGRVAIIAHLLSGARTCGIEIQAQLVERSRDLCGALGLTNVSFVHANAAEQVPDGTLFFLHAPCNGAMFSAVLQRVEAVAARQPIVRVAAVGIELDVPWLVKRTASSRALTLYDAR